MPRTEDNSTIVFSDIVGSSRLYATLGNQRAKEKIDQALGAMQGIAMYHQGEVIKTIGDEIMCAFQEPDQACEAAIALNQGLNLMHFYLRTGMCFGKVIHDQNDIFGDTVNNAAYLAKGARANQILLDENTYSNLTDIRSKVEYFDRITFKDQVKNSIIYRLNWEQGSSENLSATIVTSKTPSNTDSFEKISAKQLVLHCEGVTHCVREGQAVIVGRDKNNVQIVVQHKNASRKHCTIRFHRGKFILKDHSTNGTYVQQKAQKEVFLKQESVPLVDDGSISLGQPISGSERPIEYFLE